MTIQNVKLLMSISIVLFVYFITAPIVGCFKAWVAGKMGDDTPEDNGFLTLNPFAHVSKFWIVIIIYYQILFFYAPIGMGKPIFLNPVNIQGRNRVGKLLLAYFSDTLAAFAIGITSFFLLLFMHGMKAILLLEGVRKLDTLFSLAPGASSLSLITTLILVTSFSLATLMAAFSCIFNFFYFMYSYFFEESLKDNEYAGLIALFGPLLLFYLTVQFVGEYIFQLVIVAASMLAWMVGIIG